MQEYHKINTIYKRDMSKGSKHAPLILGDWSSPEFEFLQNNTWEWTEKIDGTNIRVGWNGTDVEFGGRTDKAQIPTHLLKKLQEIFTVDKMRSVFGEASNDLPLKVVIYGEGYGAKIQQGGNYLPGDVNFILFDIQIGPWWLQRADLESIAVQLEIPIVPVVGYGTLHEAEAFVRRGFKSLVAANKNYDAEGLVCRPLVHLKDRAGQRIITKIKTKDFTNCHDS